MEHYKEFKVGDAEFQVTFRELTRRLASRLDDMTSELFFDPGGRRGMNLQIGRLKDIVVWDAVKTTRRTQKDGAEKTVRMRHPERGGQWEEIKLADPHTFDLFPIINSDVDYMANLEHKFMEQVVAINPWLAERWTQLFGPFLPKEDQNALLARMSDDEDDDVIDVDSEEVAARANPTESGGGATPTETPVVGSVGGTFTSEPTASSAPHPVA